MLYWTLMFLLISIVAGLLGFGVISSAFAGAAKIAFVVFLLLFLASLIRGLTTRRL
jgi:uncharacterized membrane protein YtjA (UPF0391 family)